MTTAKSLILIAHEGMENQLVKLVKANRPIFESYRLLSTKETGALIEKELGLEVSALHSISQGAEVHLCGLICTTGVIRAVFFLRDPLATGEGQPDISPFYRVCDLNKVPLATNVVAAAALMPWLGRKEKAEGTSP
ncbi:MAG: methylglyoxal synthase [Rhodospirillaceae bacterium]|nr:methylglyoxal synthase [Rhodospirillaceae bacterium]MBL6929980.1 methylglyoxal synthase [Rhodospirillales bacterium]